MADRDPGADINRIARAQATEPATPDGLPDHLYIGAIGGGQYWTFTNEDNAIGWLRCDKTGNARLWQVYIADLSEMRLVETRPRLEPKDPT